jgi:hypothetical protein
MNAAMNEAAGRSLPGEHQAAFERVLGRSLAGVRIHTDGRAAAAAEAMNAEAFALGSDVFFARGAFAPGTRDGDRRLAHELLHVAQAADGATGDADRCEDEAYGAENAVADAVREVRGVPGLPASAVPSGGGGQVLARDEEPGQGPREDAPEIDAAEYERSMSELRAFMDEPHALQDYVPSSGAGAFDVAYLALEGILELTCRVTFTWTDADAAAYPTARPQDLAWTPAEQEQFAVDFVRQSTETWSGRHTFHCWRTWWEGLSARTRITFVRDDQDPHHRVEVRKVPPGGNLTSAVGPPQAHWDDTTWDYDGNSHPSPNPAFIPGQARLDSNDNQAVEMPTGDRQVTSSHEAGHMLGLGDTYTNAENAPNHDGLVRDEFGHGVAVADDGRIMSNGMEIGPEDGVTFLEALRMVTGMYEDGWGYEQLPLTPAPSDSRPGDGPAPGPPTA